MGEKLLAFRDSEGRVGLIEGKCPHRGADLYWGRNEECGIRCVFHGFKFDVEGNCVDMPIMVETEALRARAKILAYPTLERGGPTLCSVHLADVVTLDEEEDENETTDAA